ncbi:MAG: class I SAM-dependent methyltransferase [Gammaproteobacteria bacterium]|nr:class I SAM-dependent methyltransferase [Gammaproteobacteria bacterium]
MSEVSTRYQGEKGREYFEAAGRFGGDQDLGRIWQSRYFVPFCSSDTTVLDFGCGDGTILRNLPAGRKLGVEVNPYCLERIAAMNAAQPVPLEVRSGVAEWGEGVADLAISNHALEHVLEPFQVLRGIFAALRPGSTFVLVTPFDDWRAKGQEKWDPTDGQNHLYTWTPTNIGNLLIEAGFTVQSSTIVTSAWTPKIFWVWRMFGDRAFGFASRLVALLKSRREVVTIAKRS